MSPNVIGVIICVSSPDSVVDKLQCMFVTYENTVFVSVAGDNVQQHAG
jgi:hypothetical protein